MLTAHSRLWRRLLMLGCSIVSMPVALASQPLETETARLPARGHGMVEATSEFQTSPEGTESTIPLVFEYGLTDRLELAIEPVAFTSINPDQGDSASGFGDVEVTLNWLLFPENGSRPALALAGEIKFPTANNDLIGTGETDYRAIAIASKRFGAVDVHANLGYTFIGSPPGVQLNNIFDYALAMEYHVRPDMELVAEIIGNTSSFDQAEGGGGAPEPVLTPEAAGSETVGMIGARYFIRPNVMIALGLTYDNNSAFLIRPGITWSF